MIGNPPYFQIQYSSYSNLDYFNQYEVFERSGDIYSLFFEKSLAVLKDELGYLSFITSNRFCNTNYGRSTRKFLSQFKLINLINFNDIAIFDEANVGTLISILKKEYKKENIFKAFEINDLYSISKIQEISNEFPKNIQQDFFQHKQWIFAPNKILKLKDKLENKGNPLKEVTDLKINRGITTGANPIFIIDKKKGDELIKINSENAEILKPVLKGAEIKRFHVKEFANYIILTKTGIEIKNYPEIYEYLLKHQDKLKNVYEARKGMKEWYELRKCSYYESFEKEKLIWTRLSNINSFAISTNNEYSIDSTSFAIGEKLKYYSAILNSKVVLFYFKLGSVIWGKDGIKWFGDFFDNIPIPNEDSFLSIKLENTVNDILSLKQQYPAFDSSNLEDEIDQMVYELYGLTEEEIKIVENS